MKAQHWFHCSQNYWGERWTAERITPPCVVQGVREPRTPRLCVCSTVAACFAARLFQSRVYIYRTAKPRRTVPATKVWDSIITQERWIIPPVEMRLVGSIDENTVTEISSDQEAAILALGRCTVNIRLEGYYRAIQVLQQINPTYVCPKERRIVKAMLKYARQKPNL